MTHSGPGLKTGRALSIEKQLVLESVPSNVHARMHVTVACLLCEESVTYPKRSVIGTKVFLPAMRTPMVHILNGEEPVSRETSIASLMGNFCHSRVHEASCTGQSDF